MRQAMSVSLDPGLVFWLRENFKENISAGVETCASFYRNHHEDPSTRSLRLVNEIIELNKELTDCERKLNYVIEEGSRKEREEAARIHQKIKKTREDGQERQRKRINRLLQNNKSCYKIFSLIKKEGDSDDILKKCVDICFNEVGLVGQQDLRRILDDFDINDLVDKYAQLTQEVEV